MKRARVALLSGWARARKALPHGLQDFLTHLPTSRTESTPALCESRGWACNALEPGSHRPLPAIEGTSAAFARDFPAQAAVLPSWAQFAAEIPGGRVLGTACTAIAPGGVVLADVSPHNWVRPEHHRAFVSFAWAPPPRRLPGITALAATSGRSNYYHWMFDMVPRIELVLSGMPGARIDRWLVPRTRLQAATDLLAACGVDASRTCWQPRGGHVECERLLVSGPPAPLGGPTARSIAFLRERCLRFAGAIAPGGRRKLLLLRRGTRRIANLADLEPVIRDHGLEAVATEGLGLAEQVRLFSEARVVVGVHGAGLANAVFMPPGAAMVEVMPPWYMTACYLVLANEAGMRYRAVEGGRADPAGKGAHQDVTVDPGQLDAQLRSLD